MKYALLLWLVVLAVSVNAATLNEADYPAQYVIVTTSKAGSLMIGNFCSMTLRDQAAASIALIVQRRGHGACHIWDSGTVFHGRREKNSLKLLTTDDKGNPKVEDWPITGPVALCPPAN